MHKAKKNKNVYLLSSTHTAVPIDTEHRKKLPLTMKDYNSTKCGIDIIDQMTKYHTCKMGTRHWPVAVFFNLLDIAVLNSWILNHMVMSSSVSHCNFTLQLVKQFCRYEHVERHVADPEPSNERVCSARKCGQCQFHIAGQLCSNKTPNQCRWCGKACRGKHSTGIQIIVSCKLCT